MYVNLLDSRFEVINAAVNGYEMNQQLIYYNKELYKYDVDIIVFAVVLNDPRIAKIL